MAIIKYKLVTGEPLPSYVFDIGGFRHPTKISSDPDTYWMVGIGLGGGTVITHAELLTYVQEIHAIHPFQKANPDPVDLTDSEVEAMVVDWYTEKGHTNPDGR